MLGSMAVGIELLDSKSAVIFITLETGVRLVWFPDHQYGTHINTRSSLWLAIPTCILIIVFITCMSSTLPHPPDISP